MKYKFKPKHKHELICIIFNEIAKNRNADLNHIDTSLITDMSGLFEIIDKVERFDIDISLWDVSNVKNMNSMFHDCRYFDGDISTWDTSSVEDMENMFLGAKSFTGSSGMFRNTQNVRKMSGMFLGANVFNGNISGWDIRKVWSMTNMFCYAGKFNRPIGKWDMRNVVSISGMFDRAESFNQDLTSWDLRSIVVEELGPVFEGATSMEEKHKPSIKVQ